MKKTVNTENTETNVAAAPSNGRRTKKRGRKAASSKKALTKTRTKSPNAGTMKLISQAQSAIDRANKFLGKIKF